MKNKSRLVVFVFCIVACVTYSLGQSVGNASYYANRFHGRLTASGKTYNKDSMTCAHLTYPFGTLLKVKNIRNGKEVIVEVTDRGPYTKKFMIDLSYAAAKKLDIIRYGYSPVEVSVYTPTIVPYKLAEVEHELPILELTEIPKIPLSEILSWRKPHSDSVKLKKIKNVNKIQSHSPIKK